MSSSKEKIEAQVLAFQEACRRSGSKATHQRTAIFRAVISTASHPDAQTVYREVKKEIPSISLDTVYRNLKMLAENGFLQIAGTSHDSLRFDGNMDHHHHFTCVRCGLIRDFTTPRPQDCEIPEEATVFGEVHSLHMEVKGVCSSCRNKEQPSDSQKKKA